MSDERLTDDQLREMLAASQGAYPAPWAADIDDGTCWTGKFYVGDYNVGATWCTYNDDRPGETRGITSLRLIETMRNNIEAMAKELLAARARETRAHEAKTIHDCPCCVCGLIELSWSDRTCFIHPGDTDELVDAIVACAKDHAYDRGNGVPYGLNSETEDRVGPIVAEHLSRVRPDWLYHMVFLDAAADAALRDALKQALTGAPK